MNDPNDSDRDIPFTYSPKEPHMLPPWLLLAAKLAVELKPAVSHLIKRYLSK